MIDYKKIHLDNDMPNLKEVLTNNNLLIFRYFITIGKACDFDVKYYKIEDKDAIKKHKNTNPEDMSTHLPNARITILRDKIELNYDYEGYKPYTVSLDEKSYNLNNKINDFNKWLEDKIITVIDERNCYYRN